MSPRFIVIEGPDGCGKSTQARAIAERIGAIQTCEPTRNTPIGDMILSVLRGSVVMDDPETLALLFAADRIEHGAWIKARLAAGRTVVCDRYDLSSVVYQQASAILRGQVPPGFEKWLISINAMAVRPDLTIVLDVPLDRCASRLRDRGTKAELYETTAIQRAVHKLYADAQSLLPGDRLVHVSGLGVFGVVTERIEAAIDVVRRERLAGPIEARL